MTIHRCIKSPYISQKFGENNACISEGVWPPKVLSGSYPGTCPIGSQKFYESMGLKGHNGIDRPCYKGEIIRFDVTDAETKWDMYVEIDSAGGIGIDVASREPILRCREEGCGETHRIKRRYHHLQAVYANQRDYYFNELALLVAGQERVKIRENISPGDIIGYGDSTGASSGHHVHDGTKYCDEHGDGIHTDNGWAGYFNDSFMRLETYVADEMNARVKEEITVQESYKNYGEKPTQTFIVDTVSIFGIVRKLLFHLREQIRALLK